MYGDRLKELHPAMTMSEIIRHGNWRRDGGKYANWNAGLADWLNMDDDVPPAEPIIEVKDPDECDRLALECYPEWEELHGKDDIYKRLWYQVRSYIVDKEGII